MDKKKRSLFLFLSVLLIIASAGAESVTSSSPSLTPRPPDNGWERPIQPRDAWKAVGKDLIWGFCNMYQPCVVEVPEKEYRYEMWFFGWAAEDGNPNQPGCDAIYFARSKDLLKWEVYCGEAGWDRDMKPQKWIPVVTASGRYYDEWHNGDPSVIWKDGTYYMAYSATSKPYYKKSKDHLDGMLLCIMGATSTDGIHWQKTPQPLLIEPKEVQEAESTSQSLCDFHRPSLMWDEGRWKLWFDYWVPGTGVCMGYAENDGAFDKPNGFQIRHVLGEPLIINWTNPSVIRVGNQYFSFADPPGFPPKDNSTPEGRNWSTRALCEAVSPDGINWKVIGFIAPDADAAACHVPQAFSTTVNGQSWLYVFYSTQRGGSPVYDYRYDRIRAIKRQVK
ncbi:MAG TPA: hypothetical protein PKY35_06635 [Candidatus Hydrogenedentes bacterium]|nr:hypothetical protein [Candidatus Hydrogenedentota bacterium]HOL76690.1 hypothetical protein [Candidatus Hydrogenedentota bacterium]HPO85349.1 hypothetical protein [Candidatus Hydrogenedentota bacterium]